MAAVGCTPESFSRAAGQIGADWGLGCEANLYAEVKALLGGATSVVGSHNIQRYPPEGLCLNGLDSQSRLRIAVSPIRREISKSLHPVNNFARSDQAMCRANAGWRSDRRRSRERNLSAGREDYRWQYPRAFRERVDYLKCHLTTGKLRSLLVHLAEGSPTDPASQEEFPQLQAFRSPSRGADYRPRDGVAAARFCCGERAAARAWFGRLGAASSFTARPWTLRPPECRRDNGHRTGLEPNRQRRHAA